MNVFAIDTDRLIKEMENLSVGLQDPFYKAMLEEFIRRFAVIKAAIEDGLVANWVPMTKEKPSRRGHYFVAYSFAGSDMCFFGEAMWHDDIPDNGYVKGDHFSNEGVNGMRVTHWMKIPKLPQLQEDGENG